MKILNLFAGIGGNRKLWQNVDVTAVEINSQIAAVYQDLFKDDVVVVGDAHNYLIENYKKFDFIWSSPPCPSHSRINFTGQRKREFPDMRLYEEIIFLKTWFKGLFVVENVIPYYKPLIEGREIDRHLYWSNFDIKPYNEETVNVIRRHQIPDFESNYNYDLSGYKLSNKRQVLRNCVDPRTGLHILNSTGIYKHSETQMRLFV